jgi:prepilin-type N-terminal cleavage/methylation domain-containing protein
VRTTRPQSRGFTLLEVVIVVAIIGIVAALAASSFTRQRPRSNLSNAASELQSIIHNARMTALATGHDVDVLVFPTSSGVTGSIGRVIVYEDGNFDFFSATATVKFTGYDPTVLKYGTRSQVVTTFDLPNGIVFGPDGGRGASAPLPAPLDGVDVTKACTFCDAGSPPRGAIRFDSRGRAAFYKGGTRLDGLSGASLSLTSSEVGGTLTLAVIANTGAVRLVVGP